MSDGPHRSLPLRKAWKEVAKRADQVAYNCSQVEDSLRYALVRDWKVEVSPSLLAALKERFTESDNPLGLPGIDNAGTHELRALSAGSPLGIAVVANADLMLSEGRNTIEDLCEAVGCTLEERLAANLRQVEEHYKRPGSGYQNSRKIRARLAQAASALGRRSLGKLALVDAPSVPRPRRHVGVDEGVPL